MTCSPGSFAFGPELSGALLDQLRRLTKAIAENARAVCSRPILPSAAQGDEAAKPLGQAYQKLQDELHGASWEVAKQRKLIHACRQSAYTDGLTSIPNRRAFDDELRAQAIRGRRQETPLTLVLADIDEFKKLNDRLGRQAGDAALKHAAEVMAQSVRGEDFLARIGGEEFAVIMPDTRLNEARLAANRIRCALERARFTSGQQKVAMTVSLGGSEVMPSDTVGELMARADVALFAAKHAGRNRIGFHTGSRCVLFDKSNPQR